MHVNEFQFQQMQDTVVLLKTARLLCTYSMSGLHYKRILQKGPNNAANHIEVISLGPRIPQGDGWDRENRMIANHQYYEQN